MPPPSPILPPRVLLAGVVMPSGWHFLGRFLRRGKPFLFYFDIVKCASPLVLLEFQCPTTQVFLDAPTTLLFSLKKEKNAPK